MEKEEEEEEAAVALGMVEKAVLSSAAGVRCKRVVDGIVNLSHVCVCVYHKRDCGVCVCVL